MLQHALQNHDSFSSTPSPKSLDYCIMVFNSDVFIQQHYRNVCFCLLCLMAFKHLRNTSFILSFVSHSHFANSTGSDPHENLKTIYIKCKLSQHIICAVPLSLHAGESIQVVCNIAADICNNDVYTSSIVGSRSICKFLLSTNVHKIVILLCVDINLDICCY